MTIINGVRAKYVTAITGGGTAAISNILSRGGASSWFVEGLTPYSKEALTSFLGREPEKFVSADTANQMALKSYLRAIELGVKPEEAAGLGATAVLGKIENEREGRKHQAYISVQLCDGVHYHHIEVPNSLLDRKEQECFLAKKIEEIIETDDILRTNPLSSIRDRSKTYIDLLLSKKRLAKFYTIDGTITKRDLIEDDSLIYSGSFNPFHEGHAQVIKSSGKKVFLEISITNVDKPPIDITSLFNRIMSIRWDIERYHILDQVTGIILTNTPKFFDKLWVLGPKANFLVGTDTAKRMLDPKYGNVEDLFELIETYGSKIFVCNRPGYDLHIPKDYENRFEFLPGTGLNISSTELRKGRSQ